MVLLPRSLTLDTRLTVVPWIWLLGRGRHNRVFQDKTVVQIVETVFADYADIAAWQWTDEVSDFLADKSEKELEEAPQAQHLTTRQKNAAIAKAEAEAEKMPLEMVWSDHLERDIARLREEEKSEYA